MKNIFILYIIIALQLIMQNVFAEEKFQSISAKAHEAYTNGEYVYAIELYDSILKEGYHSAALYYNLGNAYFKNKQMAHAILYYEKAKKLSPADEQINFNLNLANSLITDKIDPLPELFYKRWWRALYTSASADTWAKISILTFFLTFFMGVVYLISRSVIVKKSFFTLSLILLMFAIIFLVFASQQNSQVNRQQHAVVFSQRVTAKSSPDVNSIDLFVIHEGTKVKINDNLGDWYEIRLANGNVGWIKQSGVRKI